MLVPCPLIGYTHIFLNCNNNKKNTRDCVTEVTDMNTLYSCGNKSTSRQTLLHRRKFVLSKAVMVSFGLLNNAFVRLLLTCLGVKYPAYLFAVRLRREKAQDLRSWVHTALTCRTPPTIIINTFWFRYSPCSTKICEKYLETKQERKRDHTSAANKWKESPHPDTRDEK